MHTDEHGCYCKTCINMFGIRDFDGSSANIRVYPWLIQG